MRYQINFDKPGDGIIPLRPGSDRDLGLQQGSRSGVGPASDGHLGLLVGKALEIHKARQTVSHVLMDWHLSCWDNSVAENWFSHFKTEFYYHHRFATHREAEGAILGYIESWYSRRLNERADGHPPMHAWIDYQTSDQELLAA